MKISNSIKSLAETLRPPCHCGKQASILYIHTTGWPFTALGWFVIMYFGVCVCVCARAHCT